MKIFKCQACQQLLYFENVECERCGRRLGYLADRGTLSALDPDGGDWHALAAPEGRYRFCENAAEGVCNWLVDATGDDRFCRACQHNRTVPNVSDPQRRIFWRRIEAAKHRLFYTLIELDLPAPTVASGDPEPLVFDFLADPAGPAKAPKVLTGHDNGVITISLREADDAERERMRTAMGEPYRTLLGHFRHEVGHYYWDKLVRDRDRLDSFRALFGDERADYGEALKKHYAEGAPEDWQRSFVSAYATTHPWEDWAETWANYLHILDTLEMAGAFGIRVRPKVTDEPALETAIDFDPLAVEEVPTLIEAWLPLTFALNSLNRAMGQPDLYPFILTPPVIGKMQYIHDLIRRH